MDPMTIIVTALVLGAAAGLEPTAAQAVKDAYAGVKRLIQDRYDRVTVEMLENDPTDEARREIIKTDLEKAGAAQDEDLLRQAQALLDLIEKQEPEIAGAVGVNLADFTARNLNIEDVAASGAGVNVERAELSEDMTIKKVRAGLKGDQDPKA